ncbi:ATP-binding protein [Pseudactinotalea sp. HY158]|uniref:ATP-binding protein n=1 Tax=Pseudactinotalea sp. HY158 TaxID=2654547 RepID=UPI00129CD93D|nr:DUF4143 domain-containing protein [Pseudactinotalea sp. HY158]QGH70787.1 DUF4143 domain-containing protein [Pseudactinotalea sp. HY158]
MDYRPRVVDRLIEHALRVSGAILVEGPRACGKTATGLHHAESSVRLDIDDEARSLAELEPRLVLDGPVPRLIDEWQLEPRLWNHVRRAVDDRRDPGQFLLTSSASPSDDTTRHTGAGRILRLRMRPMALRESGHSSGTVSLAALADGEELTPAASPLGLEDLVERLCVGGWPALQSLGAVDAQRILRSYLDAVARADIQAADPAVARRDPTRVRRLLASYARHVSTPASTATIATDTSSGQGPALRSETVSAYIDALERIMVVEEQPSWGPHLRSRALVRQAPVRQVVDPSLAVAALAASPPRLLRDPNSLGLLFESLVVRDVRVYAGPLDADVLHYRDSSGREVDLIVQLRDGRWIAAEVKLSARWIDDAAESLQAFARNLDSRRVPPPAAMVVITAASHAYTRPDGVHVVPLACLGP